MEKFIAVGNRFAQLVSALAEELKIPPDFNVAQRISVILADSYPDYWRIIGPDRTDLAQRIVVATKGE